MLSPAYILIGLQGGWSCEREGRSHVLPLGQGASALPRLWSATGAGVWSLAVLVLRRWVTWSCRSGEIALRVSKRFVTGIAAAAVGGWRGGLTVDEYSERSCNQRPAQRDCNSTNIRYHVRMNDRMCFPTKVYRGTSSALQQEGQKIAKSTFRNSPWRSRHLIR